MLQFYLSKDHGKYDKYLLTSDCQDNTYTAHTIINITKKRECAMEDIFLLIAEVGAPIAGSLVMGLFIFLVIRQILDGIVDQVKTLTIFCNSLENRARTMSNEMVKIDLLVSSALELRPDIERIARAENFIEDGKLDARRD